MCVRVRVRAYARACVRVTMVRLYAFVVFFINNIFVLC